MPEHDQNAGFEVWAAQNGFILTKTATDDYLNARTAGAYECWMHLNERVRKACCQVLDDLVAESERLGLYEIQSTAATVAEPSIQHAPGDWWDEAASLHAAWSSETMPVAATELGKRTAAFIGDSIARAQATQRKAEPGGDERVAFEAQASEWGWDLRREANDPNEYLLVSTAAAWGGWQARAAQSGQRAGVAKSEIDARLRAAGLGALLSEVYARASGLLEEEQRERIEQALIDHERAIAAAATQQQEAK
ncbi:hypothetical protein SAMD00023378_3950 [Ralstonia sp. NT80]|uniref:hypothetical protein n=1 Tax=Ralstonia sp. NT80 TaxID=1218247 RepID=UPI00073FA6DB|nr:hypothetical protein [Ralstonia sp. NT80]GAQ30267.1 hypothetical protein SAMD00023378_3950 [Ralstonia sp. NT80]